MGSTSEDAIVSRWMLISSTFLGAMVGLTAISSKLERSLRSLYGSFKYCGRGILHPGSIAFLAGTHHAFTALCIYCLRLIGRY